MFKWHQSSKILVCYMATFQFPVWAPRGSVFAPLATKTSVLYQSWREKEAHPPLDHFYFLGSRKMRKSSPEHFHKLELSLQDARYSILALGLSYTLIKMFRNKKALTLVF